MTSTAALGIYLGFRHFFTGKPLIKKDASREKTRYALTPGPPSIQQRRTRTSVAPNIPLRPPSFSELKHEQRPPPAPFLAAAANRRPVPKDPAISEVVNGYKIVEKLGEGGFGAAFKVHTRFEGEVLVLKKVRTQSIKESNEALQEVKQLSVLEHPNIVRYRDFFLHETGGVCIVMEFCEGGDLYDMLRHGKKISEENLLKWIQEMCSAMQYIHSRKIIHRDLKPDNIFLSKGSVRIADFGLSRMMPNSWGASTAQMSICGTEMYMAPEVLDEKPYGVEADVWSLGIVILEMCMGCLIQDTPFGITKTDYIESLIKSQMQGHIKCIKSLQQLLRRMLHPSPKKRLKMEKALDFPLLSAFSSNGRNHTPIHFRNRPLKVSMSAFPRATRARVPNLLRRRAEATFEMTEKMKKVSSH